MSEFSLATQVAGESQRAIAEAVVSQSGIAQPGFIGQGWLIALNLGEMTAGFFLCVMLAGYLALDGWRCRHRDPWGSPANIGRRIILAFALAGVLRFGGEAASLWGWDPSDPQATIAAAYAKRLLDPVAGASFLTGLGMAFLSGPTLLRQLRREPLPVDLWIALPQLGRAAAVVALCFVAAIGVVATR